MRKDVFGSFVGEDYGDDSLLAVRDWIDAVLEKIPAKHRAAVRIDVDSVGGYEGEHHVEIKIYYDRPETAKERAEREASESANLRAQEQHEREILATLKKKYGDAKSA